MTPTCPNCKTKFPFRGAALVCVKCGLPAEVAAGGNKAVARWRKHPTLRKTTGSGLVTVEVDHTKSKRERKRQRVTAHREGTLMHRPRHGRQHA